MLSVQQHISLGPHLLSMKCSCLILCNSLWSPPYSKAAGHMLSNMVNGLAFLEIYLVLNCVDSASDIFQTVILKCIQLLNTAYCDILFSKSGSCHRCRELKIKGHSNQTCSLTPFPAEKLPFKIWSIFSCKEMHPPPPRPVQTQAVWSSYSPQWCTRDCCLVYMARKADRLLPSWKLPSHG